MIEIIDLSKKFGSFQAVNKINLKVEAGEILGFLGVNGAGKTTTMRMLTGILLPTEGRILLDGIDLLENPREAKAITGYIPDRPYLYPKLTGREFLFFCADLYEVPRKIANERVQELIDEYSLSIWQDELIESYSHGMKQRLATCAALVHDPKILIIDEPIVGLDPHGAKMLKQSLRNYAAKGMAILLSTHSLHVAEEIADRITIIHHGEILTSGTLSDLKQATDAHSENLENLFIQLTSQEDLAVF